MKARNIIMVIVAVISAISVSCKKEEKGTLKVFVRATDISAPVPEKKGTDEAAAPKTVYTFEFDTATAYISRLEMTADFSKSLDGSNPGVLTVDWTGAGVLDLLEWEDNIAVANLDAGNFSDIVFTASSLKADYPSKPNFYLAGVYNAGSFSYRITVIVNEDFEFEASAGNEDFMLFIDDDYRAAVEVSLNHLFAGVSITSLDNAQKVNNRIIISATKNTAIYAQVLQNLKSAQGVHLGDDDI